MKRKAFLIDGTAFCYRAFHAIRSLSTSDGRPTNAVYGFAVMLQSLQQKQQPDFLLVAFDVGKPTFRHSRFEAYKMQRKPMPDSLKAQLPAIKALLRAYRIPMLECEGYEGEDVLATVARQITDEDVHVFLVTGDKDALQLITARVNVFNPHGEGSVLDAASVRTRYGVGPEQMVDLMALTGDEIDNIPGVRGIGPKTATQLLQRFGTLDALRDRLSEIDDPSRRAAIETSWEQIQLSRTLARIDDHVPLQVRLEELHVQEPDWRALRALLRDLEFRRMLRSLDGALPARPEPDRKTHVLLEDSQIAGFLSELSTHASAPVAILCWADEPSSRSTPRTDPGRGGSDADQPSLFRNRPAIQAGPCTDALEPDQATAEGEAGAVLALAWSEQEAWIISMTRAKCHRTPGRQLVAWLAGEAPPKLSYDAKAGKRLLRRVGVRLGGVADDVMIAAHLLNPARTHQTLNDLSDEYLDEPLGPLPGSGAEGFEARNAQAMQPFAQRVCAVVRLHALLAPQLQGQGLVPLYRTVELPLIEVLADMEVAGIAVDLAHLAALRVSMQANLTRLTQDVHRLAGCAFNLNSPKQLAQVLFDRLKLPVIRRTKTGASTDSDVLRQLASHHPVPERLLQYRELSKLVSTYVDALPKLVDPLTGRLHTSFNQTATATGRLSSSEPNLQNIPIKTELGRSIRRAFIPGIPDGLLVAADYSQIELRVLAHLSGDERLGDAFRSGCDIHRATASIIYGLPESGIQPEQRYAMKAVNYGILYGMTAHGLSKELGIPFEEAQRFIDAYFERYPRVRAYLDRQIEQARREGFVQTVLGRRRHIPEISSSDTAIRQFGERMAVNAPIQGTAAELIKQAMVSLAAALRSQRMESRMVLQVHDELVFEVPQSELARLVGLAKRLMESAMALSVPLVVTVKAGPNWLDLKELP